jgi:predicted transcriptional regulator
MSRSVLLIPKEMSLTGAAHLLSQAQVSGAPVVDDAGCCIGVLSTTDFLHLVEKGKVPAHRQLATIHPWQIVEVAVDYEDSVEFYMNDDPVTAGPTTPIGQIARMMIDAHIHRIIVVDAMNHPIGIVSTTDVLAAVAQADVHLWDPEGRRHQRKRSI